METEYQTDFTATPSKPNWRLSGVSFISLAQSELPGRHVSIKPPTLAIFDIQFTGAHHNAKRNGRALFADLQMADDETIDNLTLEVNRLAVVRSHQREVATGGDGQAKQHGERHGGSWVGRIIVSRPTYPARCEFSPLDAKLVAVIRFLLASLFVIGYDA